MKLLKVVLCVTLLAAITTVGYCQGWTGGTARTLAMGDTGIALTQDIGSVYYNPASLPFVPPAPGVLDDAWSYEAIGTFETSGDSDYRSLAFGAVSPTAADRSSAFGGFFADLMDENAWGAAYAMHISPTLAAGVGLYDAIDETVGVIGVTHRWALATGRSVYGGLVAWDITDQLDAGVIFNLGVAYPLARVASGEPLGVITADVWDITDEVDTQLNLGAEWLYNQNLAVRAGFADGDLTFGGGWRQDNWSIDIAFVEVEDPGDNSVLLGGSLRF